MRIDLRDRRRRRLFRADVDAARPPTVVRPASGAGPDVFLDWDRALDDQGGLRRCPACGCPDLYAAKRFPQVTGFVIVVLAAVAFLVLFTYRHARWAIAVLLALLGVDVAIHFLSPRRLVCYRCRSEFRDLPIPADHPTWNTALAEKYRGTTEDRPAPAQEDARPQRTPQAPGAGSDHSQR